MLVFLWLFFLATFRAVYSAWNCASCFASGSGDWILLFNIFVMLACALDWVAVRIYVGISRYAAYISNNSSRTIYIITARSVSSVRLCRVRMSDVAFFLIDNALDHTHSWRYIYAYKSPKHASFLFSHRMGFLLMM